MWEQIRDRLLVGDFDEGDFLSECIVETVHVDEVDGGAIGVVDFGDFACAFIEWENT